MKSVRKISRLMILFLMLAPCLFAQTLENRVNTLEVHKEILRSRQEALTSDVNHYKQAVHVDMEGNVGMGTMDPEKNLHVAGDVIIEGTLEVSGNLRGFPTPDFDSGWFAVTRNRTYGIVHNLEIDELPSKIQIYVSNNQNPEIGTHMIYLMNQTQFYYTSPTVGSGDARGMGAYIRILNRNQINIMTGSEWVFYAATAGSPAGPSMTSGFYRVRIWK